MSDVEDLLGSALRGARSDPRWDVTPSRVDLAGVRRAAEVRHRRVRATAVTTAGLVLVLGGGWSVGALAGQHSESLRPAAPVPTTLPAPVPSITPAWRPSSARDWVMTHERYLAFVATHQVDHPSSPPTEVPSPAPLTPASAALDARARGVLPAGSTLDRDDAPGGEPGVAAVHVTLPDGTPLEVQQRQLAEPQDETWGDPVLQVPGSDDLYGSTTSSVGFSFPGEPDGVNAVHVVDRRGRMTTWYSPRSVPLQTLTDWVLAASS